MITIWKAIHRVKSWKTENLTLGWSKTFKWNCEVETIYRRLHEHTIKSHRDTLLLITTDDMLLETVSKPSPAYLQYKSQAPSQCVGQKSNIPSPSPSKGLARRRSRQAYSEWLAINYVWNKPIDTTVNVFWKIVMQNSFNCHYNILHAYCWRKNGMEERNFNEWAFHLFFFRLWILDCSVRMKHRPVSLKPSYIIPMIHRLSRLHFALSLTTWTSESNFFIGLSAGA